MTLLFDYNCEYEVSVSHTKVTLPSNKKGYLSRWRIEEYFMAKKQAYDL